MEALLKSHLAIFLFFIISRLPYAIGYFEFSSGSTLFKATYADCPAGVVLLTPAEITCSYPRELPYTMDICTGEKFDMKAAAGLDPATKFQVQVIEMRNDDDPIDLALEPYKSESCRPFAPNPTIYDINPKTSPVEDVDELIASLGTTFGSEERDNIVPGVANDDSHVKVQTQRLLMYMNGLFHDENEADGPRLRITQVLKKSFEVFRKHCPTAYVPKIFSEEVQKAFLYIVREGDLAMVRDINEDDFNHIMDVLNECAAEPGPIIKFNGRECPTRGIIYNITTTSWNAPSYPPIRNHLSFRWGKYDPPTDAAWSVTDFVHGLCYGKFELNVNKHHLYQRAMERLFTPEIIHRWQRPLKLNDPDAWDHALRSKMKDVMKNLEGCVQGAYIQRPFLHRLERPMARFNPAGRNVDFAPPSIRRRKRSVPAAVYDGLNGNVVCFQDAAQKEKLVEGIKKASCDGTEKPVYFSTVP